MRSACVVALLSLLAISFAQNDHGLAGLAAGGAANPFLNENARSLQFGRNSPTEVNYCLAQDVSFGGPSTFESYLLVAKPDGAIFTSYNLHPTTNKPHDDETISFRVVNWKLQLFLGGFPIGSDRTNPADITSVTVATPNMLPANKWVRVFGTVNPTAEYTEVCVYAQVVGEATLDFQCNRATIAWIQKVRTHTIIGDGSVLGLPVQLNLRGNMENLRLWRKVLSATDILSLTTVAPGDTGVVASWSFDECIEASKVTSATDTSGGNNAMTLSCGNGDAAKQPICVSTNSPYTQVGPLETNPPVVGNLGSGRTEKPKPPPTTKPPPPPPNKCPKPADCSYWGDPHFTCGGSKWDFQGAGWHWIARHENWAKEVFGVQVFYKLCNTKYTCGAGVAWINKRELGWFKYGEAVGIKQDETNIPFKGPSMTTPAGTQIYQKGNTITVVVPGFFTFKGEDSRWSFTFDKNFEGRLADGSCIPANDGNWGKRQVANSDLYYKGSSPPACETCVPPPHLRPPVCPRSADTGAECDGPEGVPCKWSSRCECIAQICWNTDFVTPKHRSACLTDTSGTGGFDPATAISAIDETWSDCKVALATYLAATPNVQPDDPKLREYRCHAATKCPKWCSGPCQGTCNLATGACTCKKGFGGADCSVVVKEGKKRQFDATTNEITALFSGYYDVESFYGYDPATKSARATNPIAAPKTATFFLHRQVPPEYLIAGNTLPADAEPVNSFGVIINSASSAFSGELAIKVKLVNQQTGEAITGTSVSIRDDPTDSYTWDAAAGSGSFSWTFGAAGTAGVVIGKLPSDNFCAQISITSATGIQRFVAAANNKDDNVDIPILTTLPVSAGSSFEICSSAPNDECNALADCGACNARPECGWCASTGTCHRGDAAGPYYTACSVWRSETNPAVSRLVENLQDTAVSVRTTQIRTYLAPDNAQLTVPVHVRIPPTVGSQLFQVRGLFEFTDQMSAFTNFLATSGTGIIDGIQRSSPGSRFGVSSFRDKTHVRPHGRAGDYIYKEHAAFQKTDESATPITSNWATWSSSPSLVADWQPELGLGTLEALFHETHQGWPLHPSANSKHVVMIFTRSPIAEPGIAVTAADDANIALGKPLAANNLDEIIDDYEDYPDYKAVAAALLSRGIVPVFVVPDATGTEEVVASYRSFIKKIGFGKVWPDVDGNNALRSTMSASDAANVISSILADLVTSVQIVASNPHVTSTLASPVLFNGDNFPLGAVVKVPITLQRETGSARKRDLSAELYRLFYRDRQMVSVVGLGQLEVLSTTTDAPSAENHEFTITVDQADPVAHVITLPSWSVYDQKMSGYIVTRPTKASLYNILPGATPEQKGNAIASSGLIEDILHRVFIDIPAGATGVAGNGYLYDSFTYKMVDSCGMESAIGTVNIRVVPPGMHAPIRYEPSADFHATVNENTKWAPTSTLVCVGGLDHDANAVISVKVVRTPTNGKLYKIVDSRGTRGAEVQVNDVITGTFDARPKPAVACFVYVPPVRDVGMESPYGPGFGDFHWQLIDDTGLVSREEVTEIDVLPVNYPPVTADTTVTGWENTDLNINLVATDDPRPDGINNNMAVSVRIGMQPARGVLRTKDGVTLSASNPTVVLSLTDGVPVSVTYTPDANTHSDVDANTGALAVFDYFTYTATDAGGLQSTASVRILITPASAQPVIAFSNPSWSWPVVNVAGEPHAQVCLAVSNLRDASSTIVYITSLPAKGSVSVNGVAAAKAPVAVAASNSAGTSATFCFDYNSKKAGQDSVVVKVCQGCPAPTDNMFSNYLGGAPAQTITLQVGSQKSASASGLPKGGVIAVAIIGSLLGLALLGLLGFFVYRATQSSGSSSGTLKAPLL